MSGVAMAPSSSSRGRTSTRQPRNVVVELDEDDVASTSSSIRADQLRARLRQMRRRVEDKQRHVSNILNSVASSPIVFSIFDQQGSGDDESSQDDDDSLPPMKEQEQYPPISIQATASSSTEATPTTIPYHSTSSDSNRSSPYDDLESGGYEGERRRGMEQQHWATNVSSSSQRNSTAPMSKPRRSNGASRATGTNNVTTGTSNDGVIAPVPVVNTTRDVLADSHRVLWDSGAVLDHDSRHAVVPRSSTSAHHLRANKNKDAYAHKTSSSDLLDGKKKKSDDEDDNIKQQHHARSLMVPTGEDDDDDKQQVAGVRKSNRRSLISCCWDGSGVKLMPDYDEHLGEGRQYWRDIILGVNDGLVSTFLLIAGVTGAHLSNTDILLTALSGTIAGAISMAAGEYVATKTQTEVMEGEIALERKHISKNRDFELAELKEAFGVIGIPEEDNSPEVVQLRQHLMNYYATNDEAHLQVHAVLELGVVEEEKRNEFVAGGVAFFLFFFGAMPSVIPFLCTSDITVAFIAAGVCTTTGLLLVGVVKTWATRGNLWMASLENLLIAAGGGSIAYGVGIGFEKLVHR